MIYETKEIRVDNHIYDVKSLSKYHPGGELFVKLFAGRDATNAFLSYHRRNFPHERMREHLLYESTQPKNTEPSKEDYLELCSIIEQVVPLHKSHAPASYYMKATVLLTTALTLEAYMHLYNYYCWYLTGTLGLIMALIGLNVQHDANHGAISRRPWVNRLLGMSQNWIGGSAIDWMHQHVVQHHLHTNHVLMDPDIQGSSLLRFNPIKSVASHHVLQHVYFFFLIGLMGMDIIVESLYNNMVGFHHTKMSPWLTYNRLFETVTTTVFGIRWIIIPLLQQGTWEMRMTVMVQIAPMYIVAGYYLAFFFIISHNFVGVAHYFERGQMNSFLFQQVASSSNVGGSWLCFLNGGLNYQIEHHLFPRIHHSHYPRIAPIVREFCLTRKIPYKHFATIYDNLCSFIQHIYDLGNSSPGS
jgi:fatty acid desaturase (delta-4 desaturase)